MLTIEMRFWLPPLDSALNFLGMSGDGLRELSPESETESFDHGASWSVGTDAERPDGGSAANSTVVDRSRRVDGSGNSILITSEEILSGVCPGERFGDRFGSCCCDDGETRAWSEFLSEEERDFCGERGGEGCDELLL